MFGSATLAAPPKLAGMGQIAIVSGQELARAVLGSCVGVTMYDSYEKLGALAHVVLPASDGRSGTPGKFVDTAIPWMVEELLKRGASRRRIVAKLAGGSKMFTAQGPFLIGEQNAFEARKFLKEFKIPLLAEHLAGSHGRRVTLNCDTGLLDIEVVGQSIAQI
jgi:chemotaxis protein CheD